jgi:hypothetical protein
MVAVELASVLDLEAMLVRRSPQLSILVGGECIAHKPQLLATSGAYHQLEWSNRRVWSLYKISAAGPYRSFDPFNNVVAA